MSSLVLAKQTAGGEGFETPVTGEPASVLNHIVGDTLAFLRLMGFLVKFQLSLRTIVVGAGSAAEEPQHRAGIPAAFLSMFLPSDFAAELLVTAIAVEHLFHFLAFLLLFCELFLAPGRPVVSAVLPNLVDFQPAIFGEPSLALIAGV